MAAYVVVDAKWTDRERQARYRELAVPSVERHGGRFLVRAAAPQLLEGEWVPERLTVVEFPSIEQAKEWYASDDYREAHAVREGAGILRMVLVEGV